MDLHSGNIRRKRTLNGYAEALSTESYQALKKKWNTMMDVRDDVLKTLEQARAEKLIGKSLTASIKLYPVPELKSLLEDTDDLEKLFIVSKAEIAGEKEEAPPEADVYQSLAITVQAADGDTCERCWTVSETVGEDKDHPTLCSKCSTIVKEHYSEV